MGLAVICVLALAANHYSHNSFVYLREVMRVLNGTVMDIDGRSVDIPRGCYITPEDSGNIRYPLTCNSQLKSFIILSVRDVPDAHVKNIRHNLAEYPHADIRNEFIYFAWPRAGDEFAGVVDHYVILPSLKLGVSGDDRDLVLQLARDIVNHDFEIDPVEFEMVKSVLKVGSSTSGVELTHKGALRRWVWNSSPEMGQYLPSTTTGGMAWRAPNF